MSIRVQLLSPLSSPANASYRWRDDVKTGIPDLVGMPRLQTYVLCTLSAILCLPNSLIGPFFPSEALRHQISLSSAGLILGVFPLALVIGGPVFGGITPTLGPKIVILSGGIIIGITTVMFAFVDLYFGGDFIAACIAIRFLQGVGCAAFYCGSNAIIGATFTVNEVGKIAGFLELFGSIGYMIGPFIGGLLFEWQGFRAPFIVVGVVILVTTIPLFWIVPRRDKSIRIPSAVTTISIVTAPGAPLILIASVAGMTGVSFIELSLEPLLSAQHASATFIGVVFAVSSTVYAVASPLIGMTIRPSNTYHLVGYGLATMSMAFCVLGPVTYVLPNIWMQCASVSLLTLGFAFALLPMHPLMLDLTEHLGSGYSDVLSGTLTSANGIGEIIGPLVGGFLIDGVGMSMASTFYAIALFAIALLMIRPARTNRYRPI